MDYEFHVGDYVETKDGSIGYITKVDDFIDKDFYQLSGNLHTSGSFDFYGYVKDIRDYFIRIGQYEFTKKDKIERINYTDDFICKKMKACDVESMFQNKINELVDAINEMREKKCD